MPSLRHSSATLSSPRRPAITIRILSSVEKCRRVARLIARTVFSASSESASGFCLIFAPSMGYDEPETLPSSITQFCPTHADGQQATGYEVAWKVTGVDQYTLWNTDNNGNFTGDIVSSVPGSNAT